MAQAEIHYVKIQFELEQDEDGYPPYTVENLWALEQSDGYELDNIPWYAKGVSCGDMIAASPDGDGRLTFNKVLRRSGNSTLRVWLSAAAVDQCRQVRNAIERLGATLPWYSSDFIGHQATSSDCRSWSSEYPDGQARRAVVSARARTHLARFGRLVIDLFSGRLLSRAPCSVRVLSVIRVYQVKARPQLFEWPGEGHLEACPMPSLNKQFTTYSLTPDRTAQKQAAE